MLYRIHTDTVLENRSTKFISKHARGLRRDKGRNDSSNSSSGSSGAGGSSRYVPAAKQD